jgi:hypothetical protein
VHGRAVSWLSIAARSAPPPSHGIAFRMTWRFIGWQARRTLRMSAAWRRLVVNSANLHRACRTAPVVAQARRAVHQTFAHTTKSSSSPIGSRCVPVVAAHLSTVLATFATAPVLPVSIYRQLYASPWRVVRAYTSDLLLECLHWVQRRWWLLLDFRRMLSSRSRPVLTRAPLRFLCC